MPSLSLRALATYSAGNSLALLAGLIGAYLALAHSAGTASVLSITTTDAMNYHVVGGLILAGHGSSIYSWAPVAAAEARAVGAPLVTFGAMAYLCPPYFALLWTPLALLPFSVTYLVWLAANCLLLCAAMYLLEQYAGLTRGRALTFRLASLTFLPVFTALGLGQTSLFLLALVTICFVAVLAGRDTLAGVALAAASLKPEHTLPLLLVLILWKRWHAVRSFAVTGAVLLLAGWPLVGVSGYLSYLRLLRQVSGWQGHPLHVAVWVGKIPIAPAVFAAQWNHSLFGAAELLLPKGGAAPVTVLLAASLLLGLAVFALRCRQADRVLAVAVIAGLLVSPHTLVYDLTLLLIPVAVALRHRTPGLGLLLALGYIAVTAGYKLAFFVPVQSSVPAMLAMTGWLMLPGGQSEPAGPTMTDFTAEVSSAKVA